MCFILHIFDCDEREWCELECVNWVGANRIRPVFILGNIFVLNSIVLNLIWANSFGANRLFGRMLFGANAIRPYGNIIHRIAIWLDCFH